MAAGCVGKIIHAGQSAAKSLSSSWRGSNKNGKHKATSSTNGHLCKSNSINLLHFIASLIRFLLTHYEPHLDSWDRKQILCNIVAFINRLLSIYVHTYIRVNIYNDTRNMYCFDFLRSLVGICNKYSLKTFCSCSLQCKHV